MSEKINQEQLKTMIANKIKDLNLHDVLDNEKIDIIKDRINNAYKHDKAINEMPDMIPEATVPAAMGNVEVGEFPTDETPDEEEEVGVAVSVEKPIEPTDLTQQPGQNIDAGTTGNIPAYTPELPSFLDKIEPAKIIIFSQNELSEGGENLSHKPLRTFSDPDAKKSMHDYWIEEGKKRADVYIAKLEKIGEIEFNYANGTSQFIEKRFEPDFEAQAKYKENPYMADNAGPATPGILDINGQPNIMNQIASAVDLEKVVSDLVMKILQNQFMTNQTKAANADEIENVGATFHVPSGMPKQMTQGQQARAGMMEGFDTTMMDIVNNCSKIDAPVTLREAIEKGDKKFLVRENKEVQEWKVDDKTYFTPVNKISTKKCYVKL
jgi:hypothetical protein